MPEPKKQPDWVKLPATLDSPGFKKASDEFLFTFASAKKHLDPYIQDMQAKLGTFGVVFYVPCQTTEQVEALLRDRSEPTGIVDKSAPARTLDKFIVPLDLLAEALGMTERNVQILAAKELLVSVPGVRGKYDTLATCAALYKAFRGAENGATDAYNDERTKAMRLKRQERELTLLERVKRLTDAEATVRAFTKLLALINSKLNMMPKTLSLSVEMVSAVEAETVLDDWKRRLQSELSSHDVAKLVTQEASVDVGERAAQPGKKNKGKKKK